MAGGDPFAVAVDVVIVVRRIFRRLYEQGDDPAAFCPVVSPPEVAAVVPPPFDRVADPCDAIFPCAWGDGSHVPRDTAFRRNEVGFPLSWGIRKSADGEVEDAPVVVVRLEDDLDGERPVCEGEVFVLVENENSRLKCSSSTKHIDWP